MTIDDSIREMQISKIAELKNARDNEKVKACLKHLAVCASDGHNLMPAVMEAVDNHCTLGEIAGELRQIFGEYRQ
jgi:methylmalonyl-CoA mutase N-terminal domain/subunit